MRPLFRVVLVPSTPMKEERLSTAGSFRITAATRCCKLRHLVEGNALVGFGDCLNLTRVLNREKSFRE